jgi:hypothetical protein
VTNHVEVAEIVCTGHVQLSCSHVDQRLRAVGTARLRAMPFLQISIRGFFAWTFRSQDHRQQLLTAKTKWHNVFCSPNHV